MKLISLLVALAFYSGPVAAQSGSIAAHTFLTIRYDSIKIYDYNGDSKYEFIVEKGYVSKSVTKSARLDSLEAATLGQKLEQKNSFIPGMGGCFEPHLGVIYWYKGKVAESISICVTCNGLSSSLKIKAQQQISDDGNTYPGGMSKSFLQYLDSLLKKYHFSHRYYQN